MFNIFVKLIKFNCIFIMLITSNLYANSVNNIYNYNFKDIDGNILDLKNFEGKPILLVNTASMCGFTKQYQALEQVYQNYKDKGLIVLGVPSNSFKQEYADENRNRF